LGIPARPKRHPQTKRPKSHYSVLPAIARKPSSQTMIVVRVNGKSQIKTSFFSFLAILKLRFLFIDFF
jgi:hypothetical protein